MTLKDQILQEIHSRSFPDLKILYQSDALDLYPSLLLEMLEERKAKFQDLISIPLDSITFDDFDDFNPLSHLFSLINHLDMVDKSDTTKKIIADFEPLYNDFSNQIGFSKPLYERICHVLENHKLSPDQHRILSEDKKAFELRGINLDETTQKRLGDINIRLSSLSQDFEHNIVASQQDFFYHTTDSEALKDLPETTLEIAKERAQKKGQEGYVFDADPTAFGDIMQYSHDPEMRKYFSETRLQFASSGEYDNRPVILEILSLRDEKAKLLGYNNYAELSLAYKMAKTPDNVTKMLDTITPKAREKGLQELQELKSHFQLDTIESWDVSYYANLYKQQKYHFDDKILKNYFEYHHVLKYLHQFVKDFLGVELREMDVNSYHPDVKVYEVYSGDTLIAYYFLDAFYRDTKRGGAWADNLRAKYQEKVPIIVNVCNFQSGGSQTLLTIRDVETIFHEFGHALHEMLTESEYSDLSGFSVEWDFVELPSQLLENWVNDREGLTHLARHYQTGESIPDDILDTLDILKTFGSGMFTLRQNEFAILDMFVHSQGVFESVEDFESKYIQKINEISLFPRDSTYKIYCAFSHIFAGGYAAGYYSYMWAELLEADVFTYIKEKGMFDPEVGAHYTKTILSQGSRKDGDELFFDFMGRELSSEAFMKRKGF